MPVELSIIVPKKRARLSGINHYWTVMMDHEMSDRAFMISDIFAASHGADRSDINDFCRRLEKAKIIACINDETRIGKKIYRIIERQTAAPRVRRDGTVLDGVSKNHAMWNYMRTTAGASSFTAHDLVAWASTDDTNISLVTAKSYITLLARAGYLIELAKGTPGKLAIWRLAPDMNTGPLPPMILRSKMVFDQNRYEVVGNAEISEVTL